MGGMQWAGQREAASGRLLLAAVTQQQLGQLLAGRYRVQRPGPSPVTFAGPW